MKRIAKALGMIILMLALGYLLLLFIASNIGYTSLDSISLDNSNAKLTFTNTAAIITKYEAKGGDPKALDGAYWGSLYCTEYPRWQDIDWKAFDFDNALKCLMGDSRERAGYYFVFIRDGLLEQAYWSRTDELLRFAERFAERAETDKLGADVYNGGEKLGGYPEVMTTVVKEPPEWLDITFADIIRRAGRTFANDFPWYCVLLFPLFVYACLRLVKWGVRKIKMKKLSPKEIT